MHTCPDCGQACSCNGDIEDHWNENESANCGHYLIAGCLNENDDE